MQNKKAVIKKRGMALSQVLILIVGIIAIGYALGSGVRIVSAAEEQFTLSKTGYTTLYFKYEGAWKWTPDKIYWMTVPDTTVDGGQFGDISTWHLPGEYIPIMTYLVGKGYNEGATYLAGKGATPTTQVSCNSAPITCPSKQVPTCVNNEQVCKDNTNVVGSGSLETLPDEETPGSLNPTPDGTNPADATYVAPNGVLDILPAVAPLASAVIPTKAEVAARATEAATGEFGTGNLLGPPTPPGLVAPCAKLLCKPFFKATGQIIKNAAIAAGIYYGIKAIGPFLPLDKSAIDSASKAVSIGYFAGSTASALLVGEKTGVHLLGNKVASFLGGKFLGIAGTTWIGIGVTVIVFVLSYKKSEEQTIAFQCLPWQSQLGGKNCEQCNKGIFPCTEYQCKSLGQACELVNQESVNEKLCIWKNRKDTKPPVIQPWEDALSDSKLSYKPDGKQSPPDRGVYVNYDGKCLPAFTPFSFGIKLDEPATCKADTVRKKTYDEMSMYFGGTGLTRYNFTQTVSHPSNESLAVENLTLQNDGNFEIYVRCIDVNGNPVPSSPSSSFVFKYCVDKGPDAQAPIIVGTNPITLEGGVPIGFNQSSMGIEVYVNEPSECKWTRERDLDFGQMEGNTSCSSSVFEMNAQMLYKCATTLTGIKNQVKNDFYFRCKDKPKAIKDRNVMTKGYKFTIKGTQPLVIDSILPNGTVRDSTSPAKITLKVETSAGYKEGDSTCYYSESCFTSGGKKDKYVMFYYSQGTSSYTHSQDLWVEQGNYQCSVRCVDLGGNTDEEKVGYRVEIDAASPLIVRAYHEDPYLKIITNEKSTCVYDTVSCNYLYDDGVALNSGDKLMHFTEWDASQTYYIKCEDEYNNQPFPNQCSIIVKPFEMFERK